MKHGVAIGASAEAEETRALKQGVPRQAGNRAAKSLRLMQSADNRTERIWQTLGHLGAGDSSIPFCSDFDEVRPHDATHILPTTTCQYISYPHLHSSSIFVGLSLTTKRFATIHHSWIVGAFAPALVFHHVHVKG